MNIAPPVESRAVAGGGGASARRVLPLRSIVGAAVVIDATLIVLADLLSFSLRYGIDVREENFKAYWRIAVFVVPSRTLRSAKAGEAVPQVSCVSLR